MVIYRLVEGTATLGLDLDRRSGAKADDASSLTLSAAAGALFD
jgi:hypothetical protein